MRKVWEWGARESTMHTFEQKMRQLGAGAACRCRTSIAHKRTTAVRRCTPLVQFARSEPGSSAGMEASSTPLQIGRNKKSTPSACLRKRLLLKAAQPKESITC